MSKIMSKAVIASILSISQLNISEISLDDKEINTESKASNGFEWGWGVNTAKADSCWLGNNYCFDPDETENDGAACRADARNDYEQCTGLAGNDPDELARCEEQYDVDLDRCP